MTLMMASAPILSRFAVLASLAVACAPNKATGSTEDPFGAKLPEATRFEILALDPFSIDYEGIAGREIDHLHGYQVLRSATVDDLELRREIMSLIESGMTENNTEIDACFNPRHGISADTDGHTIDVVICYECRSLQIYEDGFFKSGHPTSGAPRVAMNAIWKGHGCMVEP